MNVLTRLILEYKIGERFYCFECSPGSPWQEIKQVAGNIYQIAEAKIQEEEQAKNQESVTPNVEPSKEQTSEEVCMMQG